MPNGGEYTAKIKLDIEKADWVQLAQYQKELKEELAKVPGTAEVAKAAETLQKALNSPHTKNEIADLRKELATARQIGQAMREAILAELSGLDAVIEKRFGSEGLNGQARKLEEKKDKRRAKEMGR